jgi:hypothetical protein
MILRIVVILSVLIAIGSGTAFVMGLGNTADRVALVALCWATLSIPTALVFGKLAHELWNEVSERDDG